MVTENNAETNPQKPLEIKEQPATDDSQPSNREQPATDDSQPSNREQSVIDDGHRINNAEQALDLLNDEIPFSRQMLNNYLEALVGSNIAFKEGDEYIIVLANLGNSESASRLIKLADYEFLHRTIKLVPDLGPMVLNYFEMVRNKQEIPAATQQVFINRLLDSNYQIFFDLSGNVASFEDYLRSVYGKMVEIIKVESDYLDPKHLELISLDSNIKKGIDPEIIPQLSQYLHEIPITIITLQAADRQYQVPILSATFSEQYKKVNAISVQIDDNLNLICLNTKLKAGSLLESFGSIAHETDHAVNRLINDVEWPDIFTDLQAKMFEILDLLRYEYSKDKLLELNEKCVTNITKVMTKKKEHHFELYTIIKEMGGEASKFRLFDALGKGLLSSSDDQKEQMLANLVISNYFEHMISRISDFDIAEHQPYALGCFFYHQVKTKYGEQEFLRMIHQLSLEEFRGIFDESIKEAKNICQTEKISFDGFIDKILEDSKTAKIFSQINLDRFYKVKENETKASPEEIQQQIRENLSFVYKENTDKKAIFEQILPHFDLEGGEQLLSNIETLTEMVNLLAQDNLSFANYIKSHPEQLTSSEQGYAELRLQVDTLFSVYQIDLTPEVFTDEQVRRLVFELAYKQLAENFKENLAIQPYVDELQALVEKLTGSKTSKYDMYTGLNVQLPLKEDGVKKEVDEAKFAQLKAKIELLLENLDLIKSSPQRINLTDNPSLEVIKERLAGATQDI